MRVRPFFWLLLALSCITVLIFAATNHPHAPAVLQVHVDSQHPLPVGTTTLKLHLTDPQGIPIEQAEIASSARMTNMDMGTNQSHIRTLGQGDYNVELRLQMAGPWSITIMAHADGFAPLQQTLFVQVQ